MAESKHSGAPQERRAFLKLAGKIGLGVAGGAIGLDLWRHRHAPDPVKVGVLHSLSGTMSISETPLRDAALMAVEEINGVGGVLGRPVQVIVENGASDPEEFARKSEKLLAQDRVCSVFGCWTSASRKAVLPILEQYNGLLWYPLQYEGNECSRNVIYTGSTPNQQIVPAVQWLVRNGHRRFYLLGSDYVFPRTANRIVRVALAGGSGRTVGEEYAALGLADFNATVRRIRAVGADVVFSTINGDSNRAFYHQFHAAGITAAQIPIMAVSVAESEVRAIGPATTQGHYAAWAYFESVPGSANRDFLRRFQDRYGDRRVTDDPIEAAYFQVHLWAQAVRQAQSTAVDAIRQAAAGQSMDAPEGTVRIDRSNRHTWKMLRIGQVEETGQFAIRYSSAQPLDPDPWLAELNGGKNCDWATGHVETARG